MRVYPVELYTLVFVRSIPMYALDACRYHIAAIVVRVRPLTVILAWMRLGRFFLGSSRCSLSTCEHGSGQDDGAIKETSQGSITRGSSQYERSLELRDKRPQNSQMYQSRSDNVNLAFRSELRSPLPGHGSQACTQHLAEKELTRWFLHSRQGPICISCG